MVKEIRRSFVWVFVIVMAVGLFMSWPRVEAQDQKAVRLGALAVNDTATANKIDDMGTTYYALEGKAKKVSTKFKDFEAVAERDLDGTLRSKLTRSGGETSEVKARGKELEITRQGSTVITPTREGVQPTLDWLNTQAYAIARDNLTAGQGLEWQQKYLRGRGKAGDDDRLC